MSHCRSKPPAYRRQKRKKGTDLAFVEVAGDRRYLGPYNSPESLDAYQQFLAEWKSSAGRFPQSDQTTVTELLGHFLEYARVYYCDADGELGQEYYNHRPVLRVLQEVAGRMAVAEFTPRVLKAVRQRMIDLGWSRRYINRQVVRIRSVFKWGVSEGLVPVDVHAALGTLGGLRSGRTEAVEKPPVRPVSNEQVQAVLPHLAPIVADMVWLQWLTGMRPGEVCIMRPKDIDLSGEVWFYRPSRHKTQFRGRQRIVPLGPQAQRIVQPYLDRAARAYLFSPAEADQQRRAARHACRKTPKSCGNRPGSNRRAKPARKPRDHYTTQSYGRSIAYGCEAAWPHPELSRLRKSKLSDSQKQELREWNTRHRWSPNQLRHAAATRIRSVAGLEMARAILGHSTIAVTEAYYAEADMQKAAEVMTEIG